MTYRKLTTYWYMHIKIIMYWYIDNSWEPCTDVANVNIMQVSGKKVIPLNFYIHDYIYISIYTGCHRRNGPNFGRVFLMLNCTDITQNTYIQSWMVTEIMAREKCGHLAFPRSVRLQLCSALTVRLWRHKLRPTR